VTVLQSGVRENVYWALQRCFCVQNGTKQNSALGFIRCSSVSRLHLGDFGFARDREAARDQRLHGGEHARLLFSTVLVQLDHGHDWSVVAAFVYKSFRSRHGCHYSKSVPLIIGLAVFSHWILDLVAHPRDLPIYDNAAKVGFGLWNYRDPEFALEIALLAGGIVLYLTRNAMPAIRKGAVIAFGIALVIVQIGDTYVPRMPLSDKATAMGVWIFYSLFVIVAFAIEKIGQRGQADAP